MRSKIQKLIETTMPGAPCFLVYGPLIIDVRKIKYIGKYQDGSGLHIRYADGETLKYTGDDWQDIHRRMIEDFRPI